MILPRPEDVFHKIQLVRLLTAILDVKTLARNLYFKGGTCALMLDWLDRFSLDLDFDVNPKVGKKTIKNLLQGIFATLGLTVKNPRVQTLQFILGYQAPRGLRSQLRLSLVDIAARNNSYQAYYLPEVDRFAICQTKATMTANKLVAPLERFEKYKAVAARDFYDIHYFLSRGFPYRKEIIEERRQMPVAQYLRQLRDFIQNQLNEKIIAEDLNYLLPYDKFRLIRNTLKREVLLLVNDEIQRQGKL